MTTNPSATYGPAIDELLAGKRLSALGPGNPNRAVRANLEALSVETAFASHPVRNCDLASACLAALWLYHDFLDESHTLSQSLDTPEGSYWHGLMHRREPDFALPKFQKCPAGSQAPGRRGRGVQRGRPRSPRHGGRQQAGR
jgi:hypothetical protein